MKRSVRVLALFTFLFAVGAFTTVDAEERTAPSGVAALVLTLDAAAQNGGGGGVTCGWCVLGSVWSYDPETGEFEFLFDGHRFPGGGDECGSVANGGGNQGACVRCGGTSSCHMAPLPGPCHIECGPGGGDLLAAAIADLRDAIDHQDVPGIVRVVQATSLLEFSQRVGAVIAVGSCHDSEGSTVFALPAGLAERLPAALRQGQ